MANKLSRRAFLKAMVGGAIAAKTMPQTVFAQGMDPAPSASFIHPTLSSGNFEDVGTRIVCLFDISASIDSAEYDVQIEVMANAIGSKDFRDAIFFRGGPGSIAMSVVDFGNDMELRIPWLDIREGDEDKLLALANEVRNLRRRDNGLTYQVSALRYAQNVLDNCPWQARKSIVDIITDGRDNQYTSTREALLAETLNDMALKGTTVNALVTIDPTSSDANLEEWAWEHLVTPEGMRLADGRPLEPGFVKVVAFEQSENNLKSIIEYHKAMELAFRRKLLLEVAGLQLEGMDGDRPVWQGIGHGTPLTTPDFGTNPPLRSFQTLERPRVIKP